METMSQKIQSLKDDFKKEIRKHFFKKENLEAVFNIGSVANNKNFSNDFYQDFDIHFYFTDIEIRKKTLNKIKKFFENVTKKYNNANTAVEFVVRDTPWKMIPRKKQNIGIHGTILNLLDFRRRINNNYILALNMLQNSELLYGRLKYPNKKITTQQFLSEVGGIGWLKEIFYKMAFFIDLKNKNFYPVINELCYYLASSSLLHFFYLNNRKTANRKECYDFFIKNKKIPIELKEKIKYIYINQFIIFKNPKNYVMTLNNTFKILNFVETLFTNKLSPHRKKFLFKINSLITDEDSLLISEILGRKIKLKQIHYFLDDKNYNNLRNSVMKISKKISNPTTDNYTEALYNLIIKKISEKNRLFFWGQKNLHRLSNKIDYSLDSKKITEDYFINSWEKGLTTFIQRLHEMYINNKQITFPQVQLCKILSIISYKNYLKLKNINICSLDELIKLIKKNENIDIKILKDSPHEKQYFLYLELLYRVAKRYVR